MKKGGQVKQDASKFKAVLIHGPPGIGKSSSARVVIENSGYTMIELNARCARIFTFPFSSCPLLMGLAILYYQIVALVCYYAIS